MIDATDNQRVTLDSISACVMVVLNLVFKLIIMLVFWSSILPKFIKWHVWQIFRDGFPRLISSSIFGNYLYLIVVNFFHGFLQKSTKNIMISTIPFISHFQIYFLAFTWHSFELYLIYFLCGKRIQKNIAKIANTVRVTPWLSVAILSMPVSSTVLHCSFKKMK